MEWLKILCGFTPVVIFLSILLAFDSFKLVSYKLVAKVLFLGGMAAVFSIFLNQWLNSRLQISFILHVRYAAPILEEFLKSLVVFFYLRRSKIGFLLDAAILGFTAGTGFAIIENLYNFQTTEISLFEWILRGFGTAVMHGVTTAIFAIIAKYFIDRQRSAPNYLFLPGFVSAVSIHSLFNHLVLPPEILIFIQLILLPILFWIVFKRTETALHHWLEVGLDTEVGLLEFLVSGKISRTKAGEYLEDLKKIFSGEKVADMLCYLRLYLELGIRAKGILLMEQSGFQFPPDDDVSEKLDELKFLENSIGKTGKRAIAAIFRADPVEIWQIHLLKNR
jgi:RsiW-degrading membrane proteinase PrsW (M82 family)